jgi:hypothetical protein
MSGCPLHEPSLDGYAENDATQLPPVGVPHVQDEHPRVSSTPA